MQKNNQNYFLAANSCRGFISEFASNCDTNFHTYIIKGGPGTGKSSFMKKVAEFAQSKGEKVIFCPCSSDPESLDAVILEQSGIIILDGTAPHTVDPHYPAICEEILNFGDFWENDKLTAKSEIITVTNQNKLLHTTASRYIRASGELLEDNFKIANACCNFLKCKKFAKRICENFLEKTFTTPKENIRFLGGVTPKGFVTFPNTITDKCENIIIVEDNYFTVSSYILNLIRNNALEMGYEITTLKNPLFPELIDHIIIPKLSLAIVSENQFIKFNTNLRRVHSRRFYDNRLLHLNKKRIKHNNRLSNELLNSAYLTLREAKNVHDQLEKYYINAMNFEKLNNFADKFCKIHI